MLGIKINGEFLSLAPNTFLELEQANPFLQFQDEISGQFSLPFEVDASPRNLRLLNYAGIIQNKIDNKGIDAEMYDNGLQVSVGKIKIEKPTHNLNRTADGTISCYYLTGSSSFYQDIKDKKLKDIDVGGVRTFPWDDPSILNFLPDGAGFWGHIHDVIDADINAYDYAFYPVINKGFLNVFGDSELLNNMIWDPGDARIYFNKLTTDHKDINLIVPFPYLHYVLKQAVEFVGWKIEGDILSDADFLKITIINFLAIDWGVYPGGVFPVFGHPFVNFNLQNHLPDMTIAEFLIALKNRFGWWYDFDKVSKKIRIKKLSAVTNTAIKDFTKYASPVVVKKINQTDKIYALTQRFAGDYADGQPDFTNVNLQGSVETIADLPAVTDSNYGHVYLVRLENNFYINALDETDNTLKWMFFTYNIWDYLPANHTEEINTACVTLGSEKYVDSLNYQDFLPRIDAVGAKDRSGDDTGLSSLIVLFYHGQKDNANGDPLCYASSHIYDEAGNKIADWSLAYKCEELDGTQVGLYDLNWKPLLDLLKSAEELEATLYLPLDEYLKLDFGNRLIIAGVKMFILQLKPKIPYAKTIAIETVRIL